MRNKNLGLVMIIIIALVLTSVMFGWGEQMYVIKYAHNQRIISPQHEGIVIFKEKVEELSEGKVKVEIYPNNQLGSLREVIESVQGGQIELAQQPLGMIANFVPSLNVNVLPYIYPSTEIMWKVLDGGPGQRLNLEMEKQGFINLGYMNGGQNQFSAIRPLRTSDDFNGLRMRAMPAPIIISTIKAFGGSPVPIEFSELYNSLQQGLVDGQENPTQTVSMLHLYEVQDYVTLTKHSSMIYANIMNKKYWESLPKDVQEVILEAMQYACEKQRKLMADEEVNYRNEIKAHGTEIIELTDEEINAFKEATLKVHSEFADIIGADIVAEFKDEIERLSK